jgi:hypothetical protein
VVGQGGGIERITVVVHHQRRITDEMGAPELTLNGTIPLVLSFARRTSVLAFRVLLWRHIRRYVIRRDTEDEAELLKALPVRGARRSVCCGPHAAAVHPPLRFFLHKVVMSAWDATTFEGGR